MRETLERQMKEPLKLHEETTKFPLESLIHSLSHEESLPSSSMPSVGAASPFLGNQNVLASSILSAVIENSACSGNGSSVFCSKYEIHTDSEKKHVSDAGKEPLEDILEEYSQKGRNLQKNKDETKLMEAQWERDILQDTRQKESQSQENVKIQLKNTIKELEAANQLQEEMLRESDSQTEHLKKMIHSHEKVLVELHGILMDYKDSTGKKLYEHENITSLHILNLSTVFADILQDLDSEVSYLKEKLVLVEEGLESLKKDSQTQTQLLLQQYQNREQTRNQNSVHAHQVSHLESTVSQLHSELQGAKRMYEDKVKDLEKQLHLAHSEIAEAHTGQDQCSQESGNLSDRIHQLLTQLHKKEIELSLKKEQNKRFWGRNTDNIITIDHLRRELDNKNMQLQRMENTVKETRTEGCRQMEHQMAAVKEKNESIGRISTLTAQLKATKEMLHKVKEDLTAKQIDLETLEKTVSNLMACLQEKDGALGVTNKEIKKLHSQLGSGMQELQHLKNGEGHFHNVQSQCETLKLQVLEKERITETFQKQIDNLTQIVGQHSRTAGTMEVEKSQLIKEMNDWKFKVEQLKVAKDEKEVRLHEMKARLSGLELEKVKLVNICTERLPALNDMKLEKDQLMNELQASRSELAGLAEGFGDLKRNYRDKIKEMENTANRLKMQLKSAEAEVEQTRTALKTMEGYDGNAMKVAVGMQKQITAKRGQIDALQSKIKLLEEAMTQAAKEKHCLREENIKLSQELNYITAENTKITGELEILRSQGKHLKEKISKMEIALDKASMQFAECQCIIQHQEQEAMRFRLQHTLDVKELQSPGYSSASASSKLQHIVPLSHLHSALLPPSLNLASCTTHMHSKLGILNEEPLQDLKRILQELRSSDNNIPSVNLGKDDSSVARKSPLTTMRNTVDDASSGCSAVFSLQSDPCKREPSYLHTAGPQSQGLTLPFTFLGGASIFSPAPYTSSPKKVFCEERYRAKSPVHLLLTALPDDLAAGTSASPEHRLSGRKVGSPECAATGSQIDVSSMIRTEETKTEKAKEEEKLSK